MITPFGAFAVAACIEVVLTVLVKQAMKREQEAVRSHVGDVRHFEDARGALRFLRFTWTLAPTVVPQARLTIYALRVADLLLLAAMIWVGVDGFAHPPRPQLAP